MATGVLLEAESVEDDGVGVKFYVWCYNVRSSVGIDYATGDSWLDEGASAQASRGEADDAGSDSEQSAEPAESTESGKEAGADSTSEEKTYILNTNTGKFHCPTCSSVDDMAKKNKGEFTGTREGAIAQGYDPCKRCNP